MPSASASIGLLLAAVSAWPAVVHAAPPPDAELDARGSLPPSPRLLRAQRRAPALARYLVRALPLSARFLDHGVIALTVAGGYPERYRIGAAIGLLDHLTLGATAHWLPGQSRPRVAPQVALAVYRWRHVELGGVYDRVLYPPPSRDDDPKTPSFQRDAHLVAAALAFSQAWVSAGFEVGIAYGRERDPGRLDSGDGSNPSHWRVRPGGGLFLRAGTRRWGFSVNARAPFWSAALVFDVRLGAFELRPRGGWRPQGLVRATDRRAPTR